METIRKTPPKVVRTPQGTFQMDLRGVKFDAIRKTLYGGRRRINFETKAASLDEASKVEKMLLEHGQQRISALASLPNYDEISEIINLLKPFNKTLKDAVSHYIQFIQSDISKQQSKFISELLEEWIDEKKSSRIKPIRKRTLTTLATYRNIILKQFGNYRIKELTKDDIEKWLNELNKNPRTVYHHLNHLNQFLNWCYRKGYLEKLPSVGVSVDVPESHPEFFNIEQVNKIIEQLKDPSWEDLTPLYTVCLFAGVRPQEASLLNWDLIDDDYIRIPASISKTKRERLVKMEDNLKKWMKWSRNKFESFIPKCNLYERRKRFHAALPFDWISDGLRHSFATYFISKYREGGYGKLETTMGSSSFVLRRHYVRFVPDEEFEIFWNIKP